MKNIFHFFAFDLGATSGRSILGTFQNGKIKIEELTRFPNKIIRIGDKQYWNIFSLYEELKHGLRTAANKGIQLDSIGIDTWGVDFVYVGEDGSFLGLPRAYHDPYTNGIPEEYFTQLSRKEVYEATGIQIMNFNSLFQLYAAKKESSSALQSAESILFISDALSYLLTGKQVCEYTIASTSQLLNPKTKTFESKLFCPTGKTESIMQPITMPGQIIGRLTEAIQHECGTDAVPVAAVAGHDTGSAVVAVPAENKNFTYLSSGTWSLMGVEVEEPIITESSFELNFTNEGGVDGTVRFLKNITGMWLLEQCRKEWEREGKNYSYPEIVKMSESVKKLGFMVDPDNSAFANPPSMTQAIAEYCRRSNQPAPQTHAEFIRCIFDSLALKYKYVLNSLQQVAPFAIEKLHVIGGGSQNRALNQATANATGIPVIAGPAEATAIGNMMMQAKSLGLVDSLGEIRSIVRNSVELEEFTPQDSEEWNSAFKTFQKIIKQQ
ncbi:MAG: rhamnulokinase [Prevotellaceae bacterium]|jgi:rhamnulokinase|nr:rhamnulokinase [Prevotellaceae bacterium]